MTSGLWAAFFCLCSGAATASTPPDFNAALKQVDALLAAHPDDLQGLFNRGMLLSELNQPMAAADAFRAMLARDPALLRPRLELARVLADAGDLEAARYHFEQVLAHDLPDPVRRNVQGFLTRIREELPQFSAALEWVSDSNPKQATENEEVTIGGLTYRLNNDARAESAMGLRLTLGARTPVPNAPLWFVRGQGEHQEFDGKSLDFSTVQLAAGRHFRLYDHTLTLEGGQHWARYQHKPLYDGVTWEMTDFRLLRPDMSLTLGLSGLQFAYPDYPFRDGWQHSLNAVLMYAASPVTRWELRAGWIDNDAQESPYRFLQPQISLRHVREWAGGWVIGAGLTANQTRYGGDDPFFAETRHEREIRIDADIANRRIRIWRMSPRLQVGWTQHHSNLAFYDWQRAFVRLGMTGEF